MTFSDDRVVDLLNREFVCAWTNTRPDLPPSSFSIIPDRQLWRWSDNFAQGTGANNVGLLFCTSNGWVLHEMQGFFAPEAFLEELRFVLDARNELTRRSVQVAFDDAARGMRERHRIEIASLQARLSRDSGSHRPWSGRRRPAVQQNEISLRIGFHRVGLAQPLRRVEDVRPQIEAAARRVG